MDDRGTVQVGCDLIVAINNGAEGDTSYFLRVPRHYLLSGNVCEDIQKDKGTKEIRISRLMFYLRCFSRKSGKSALRVPEETQLSCWEGGSLSPVWRQPQLLPTLSKQDDLSICSFHFLTGRG